MAHWLNILLTKINKVCIDIDMKKVDFHLTEEQIEFLKRLKKETGIPASESIRRLIDGQIQKRKDDPDSERVKELFDYKPETGESYKKRSRYSVIKGVWEINRGRL